MAFTVKDWKQLPAELEPTAGETVADWRARIAAYAAANPALVTPLNAAAIEDLEQRLGDYIDTHIADTSTAHAASAIGFTPTGTISATTVQAAIAEVATDAAADLAAHTGDTSAAHAASAVACTPAGGLASTDVQAALNELDTEKQAASGKGQINGYASLDGSGKVPSAQLPSAQSGSGMTASATRPATPDDGSIWLRLAANGLPTGELEVFAATAPVPDTVPNFTVDPVITGSGVVGATLTCDGGTFTGHPTPTSSYQWKKDGVAISGQTASTYVVQAGDVSHALTCTVTATNTAGSDSATSNTITGAAAPTAPGQVTGLNATPGDTTVALAWTAPASNGGSAITTYLVEYRTPAGSGSYTTFTHSASTTPSITVTGLTNGSQYEFRVSAVNAVGTGTASATATATPASSVQTPSSIFGADLVWWARASDTPGADGDSLATIPKSGGSDTNSMVQATGSKQPVLKTAILNGKSVWRFDGVDDLAKVTFSASVSAPFTLGIVYKTRALGSTSKVPVAFNAVDTWFLLGQEGDGTYSVDWKNGDNVILGHSSAPLSFHGWTGTDDGSTGEMRLDGATVIGGSGPHTAPSPAAYIVLGATNGGALPADIDVAEVFLAKRVATSGDRTALAAYNTSEYGL